MSEMPSEDPFRDLTERFRQDAGPGPVNWEVARQVATAVASEGVVETAPLASDKEALEAIVRAAELALEKAGALPHGSNLLQIDVETRGAWAVATMDNLRPLIERLAVRLDGTVAGPIVVSETQAPPSEGWSAAMHAMEAIIKPLAPIFMGMQMGMVLGFVATRTLSGYDLCLPRTGAPKVSIILRNVDALASEIGVARDELRMWVALHELAHCSGFAPEWTGRRLQSLVEAYLDSIHLDTAELQAQMAGLDPEDTDSLRRFAENAEGLLGKFLSTDQPDVLDSVLTFLSALEGYAEHAAGSAVTGLLSDPGAVAEGLRQHYASGGEPGRLLEGMLGLRLDPERVERASSFCTFVSVRSGMSELNRMWESLETFPTKEEIARPPEWLDRMSRTPKGGAFSDLES